MRIGISALLLTSEGGYRKAGICRYIHMVIDRMIALDSSHEYILFVPPDTELPDSWLKSPNVTRVPIPFKGRLQRILWEHFQPKRFVKKFAIDVWFSTAQMVPFPCGCPRCGMLHDLIPVLFPQHFTWEKAAYQKMALRYMMKHAESILANSETTKNDIIEYANISGIENRISVTPLGPGNELAPCPNDENSRQVVRNLGVTFDKYVFALGTLEPRKNLPALFEAMAILQKNDLVKNVGLVVGGGRGWKDGAIPSRLKELGIEDSVHFLGYVDDEDLPALFGCCEAFVFPSLYEGFGMPVLEAMIVGAPVLSARRPAMQEVGGDAIEYFDPQVSEDIASCIAQFLNAPEKRHSMVEAGFQRAHLFSWDDCASKTLAALSALTAKPIVNRTSTREVIILADAASLIGGADKVAIVTAVELAKKGKAVTLLAAMGPKDPMLEGVENLTVVCLNQLEIDQAPNKFHGFRTQIWNRDAMDAFSCILDRTNHSNVIIHAHCYLKLLSSGVIKQAIDSGLPFLMTMHDYGIACPNRLFYHQPEKAICHRKPMGASCLTTNCLKVASYRKAGMAYRFWVQEHRANIRERLKHVAFVSEFSQNILTPYLPKTCQQYVLPNPVDPQKGERVEVTGNRVFTYVGRLVPEKDPVTLAIAARIADVPITFVGDGPEREEILRQNPSAEITGWVRPEQVHERLRISRAFVIPSIWYECSPLVTVEALSHGLPVICSDTNASQKSIEDGVTGFHFQAGNAESLAEKLTQLNVDDTADSLSRAAYTRFWDDPPSTNRHIIELEELYEKIISQYKA